MRILVLASALCLAACGDSGGGTAITLNVDDANAPFNASASKDGTIRVDSPIFKGSLKLPKIKLDAGNLDINGVRLPAGSKITSMNIDGKSGDDRVRIAFTSPIGPVAVREWFASRLTKEGFKLSVAGDALSGTTAEGKPFRLTARPADEGAEGEIAIGS